MVSSDISAVPFLNFGSINRCGGILLEKNKRPKNMWNTLNNYNCGVVLWTLGSQSTFGISGLQHKQNSALFV